MAASSAEDEAKVVLPKLKTYPKFGNLRRGYLYQILVRDDCARNEGPGYCVTPARNGPEALVGSPLLDTSLTTSSDNLV